MNALRRLLLVVGASLLVRLGPALIVATGISLAVAGILTYDATAGAVPTPAPTVTLAPVATPSPRPTIPEGTPAPTSEPTGKASRIVIPAMKIDLPVVAAPPAEVFPWCNVAMYLDSSWHPTLSQPGQQGTTWIFAHARTGMFLPILEASLVNNGKSMLGMLVEVYTTDNRLYFYEVDLVKRHATEMSIADLPEGVFQQLIIQTSEGDRHHKPKLQVRARFLYSQAADPEEANPIPEIVICY